MSKSNKELKLKLRLSNKRVRSLCKLFDMSQRHLEICERELDRAEKKVVDFHVESLRYKKLYYEVNNEKNYLKKVASDERNDNDDFCNMSFWKRVKFLFGRL